MGRAVVDTRVLGIEPVGKCGSTPVPQTGGRWKNGPWSGWGGPGKDPWYGTR